MIRQAAIQNIDRIIDSIERKRKIRITAGMVDAVPGITSFRMKIRDRLHDFEGSTAVIAKQPRLAEQQLIEFIDERRERDGKVSCEAQRKSLHRR